MLEYKLISNELNQPKVYVSTNTDESVHIYDYKTKILVKINGNDKTFTKDYEIVKHSGCSSVVYADKKAFDYVIKWIECNVCMFVSFA